MIFYGDIFYLICEVIVLTLYELLKEVSSMLKMRIFLYDLSNQEHSGQEIMWSCGVGFSYPIKDDLINESFEILPATNFSAKTGTKI